jgi:hypothetical protein
MVENWRWLIETLIGFLIVEAYLDAIPWTSDYQSNFINHVRGADVAPGQSEAKQGLGTAETSNREPSPFADYVIKPT